MKNTSKPNINDLSPPSIPEKVQGEHLNKTLKNVTSLRDVPLELRKKEASKPIYLIRYE